MKNTLAHVAFEARSTTTKCPHCRQDSESGTHNGCSNCGKVKHTSNGRMMQQEQQ